MWFNRKKVNHMKLFEIHRTNDRPVHVVARSPHEALHLFATWRAAQGRAGGNVGIRLVPIEDLDPQQRAQVKSACELGLVGIAHFDEEIGWTFCAPLWLPLDADEKPDTGPDAASW
jgi:hypothetical protein